MQAVRVEGGRLRCSASAERSTRVNRELRVAAANSVGEGDSHRRLDKPMVWKINAADDRVYFLSRFLLALRGRQQEAQQMAHCMIFGGALACLRLTAKSALRNANA